MPNTAYGPLCALHLTLALLVSATTVAEVPVAGAPTDIRETVDELMAAWDVPGVAVARIEQGRVIWADGFGRAGEGRPVTRETVFNVASLTKPLFATMALHAAAAGDLDLDAPLARHWTDPDIADDTRHRWLTTRLALSHQTGLPNWRGNDPLHFQFDPGTRHEYSGEGFEYVRRALERASGQSMTELMTRHVLIPAGMTDSAFGWRDTLEDRIATGYDEASEPLDMGYLKNRGSNAAANTFTTVVDYARFAAWVARGAGLQPELFAEMTTSQAAHDNPAEFFSLGWRLTRLPDQTVISHDGREDGVRTHVYVLPESGDGLVILTNSSNGELLIRPLTAAALTQGDALLAQGDRDTWHYIQSIPPAVHPRMLDFIARSPSFTGKLLHAVQRGVIEGMDTPLAATAAARIEPFVLAYHKGNLNAERVREVLGLLSHAEGEAVTPREAFDHEWLKRWIEALALPDITEPVELAIDNVTVIDPETRSVNADMDVFIDKGRIVAILTRDEDRIYTADTIVDGTNQYLVPGLMDMHVHLGHPHFSENTLALLLANGVTGVREMSGDCWEPRSRIFACIDEYRALQEAICSSTVAGPRILRISSAIVRGPGSRR